MAARDHLGSIKKDSTRLRQRRESRRAIAVILALCLAHTPMTDSLRLSKRLIALKGCSRREAEQLIEGGFVRVDGAVVDRPQAQVSAHHEITVDAHAEAKPSAPSTFLLHKPAGLDVAQAAALLSSATRSPADDSGVRLLSRHFERLQPLMPLEDDSSGLQAFTQDGRLSWHLREYGHRIEQELVVEVVGRLDESALARLGHGLRFNGGLLAPVKVSWQSETRLRFAIKNPGLGQIHWMCTQVGLEVKAIRRIRIGRIPLKQMVLGQWRYLPEGEAF